MHGGLPFSTYAPRGVGGGGASLLYISIAYYMQKGGGWVLIACTIAYVLNGRPHGMPHIAVANPCNEHIASKSRHLLTTSIVGLRFLCDTQSRFFF